MYLVCSAGGVGTTMLLKWLSKYYETNDVDDKDGLKHSTYPPLRDDIDKAIYIYSSYPEAQAVSIARHFGSKQAWKLTGQDIDIKSPRSYLDYNEDPYNLRGIIENWLHCKREYEVGFIDFERLWKEQLPRLGEFLGLNRRIMNSFPLYKERISERILLQDKELYYHLHEIYKPLKETLYLNFEMT